MRTITVYILVVFAVLGITWITVSAIDGNTAETGKDVQYGNINGRDLEILKEEAKGESFILHLWASWCPACMEEFPDFVKFFKENELAGVKVVAVSFDREETVPNYELTLREHQPTFDNYHGHFNSLEELQRVTGDGWKGGIPATFLYNEQGELTYSHSGILDFDELKAELVRNGVN